MLKQSLVLLSVVCCLAACNWKQESTYTTKYHYFLTKRDRISDSLVQQLCKGPWQIFEYENRKFNKQRMVFDNSRQYINESNLFTLNFYADSSIVTQNPAGRGTWSINNKYFIEFDFFSADSANHLRGKFDVKMRYDDLVFNQGVYTSDTSSETLRMHFFREGGIVVH
ncbi:MAG: hypothetical protein V4538_04520 [Bacteroidota bacterium]